MSNDKIESPSRRRILAGGVAILAAGAAGAAVPTARADEKLAQAIVQYQEGPNEGHECDACVNWVAPNACKIVEGTINPKGWCVAFAPKES